MARDLATVHMTQAILAPYFCFLLTRQRILAVPAVRVSGAITSDLQPNLIVARGAAA
jgi:hypothetical protein